MRMCFPSLTISFTTEDMTYIDFFCLFSKHTHFLFKYLKTFSGVRTQDCGQCWADVNSKELQHLQKAYLKARGLWREDSVTLWLRRVIRNSRISVSKHCPRALACFQRKAYMLSNVSTQEGLAHLGLFDLNLLFE